MLVVMIKGRDKHAQNRERNDKRSGDPGRCESEGDQMDGQHHAGVGDWTPIGLVAKDRAL